MKLIQLRVTPKKKLQLHKKRPRLKMSQRLLKKLPTENSDEERLEIWHQSSDCIGIFYNMMGALRVLPTAEIP